jgi:hypothetical protein
MIATYNARAVRALTRAQSRRRSPWNWAPPVAWLFLINSFALTALVLVCLKHLDPKARDFISQLRGLDVLLGVAGFLALLSVVAVGRARWKAWTMTGRSAPAMTETVLAPRSHHPGQSWGALTQVHRADLPAALAVSYRQG